MVEFIRKLGEVTAGWVRKDTSKLYRELIKSSPGKRGGKRKNAEADGEGETEKPGEVTTKRGGAGVFQEEFPVR
jgi:hypothetical protein